MFVYLMLNDKLARDTTNIMHFKSQVNNNIIYFVYVDPNVF